MHVSHYHELMCRVCPVNTLGTSDCFEHPPSPPPQKKKKPTLKSSHQFSDYCTDFLALSLISKGEAGYLSLLIKNTLTKLCTSLPPYSQYVIRQAVARNEGHLFCRTCLREWITGHGHRNCPVGRQPLQASDVRGIITFDKVVDSLQVYCPRRTEGCNWTGALETISGHQQQCLHEPIQCTHRGCSETFPRGQMQRHAGESDMRPQECGYRGVTLPFRQYHDHRELACRKAPVMCPFNCNLVFIPR